MESESYACLTLAVRPSPGYSKGMGIGHLTLGPRDKVGMMISESGGEIEEYKTWGSGKNESELLC